MAQRLAYLPYALVFLGLVALSAVSLPATPVEAAYYCGQIEVQWPGEHPDCDGFQSSREGWVTTYAYVGCPETASANDEYFDAWPVDIDDNQVANITDVSYYSASFGQPVPPAPRRLDLNEDHNITILDVSVFSSYFGKNCRVDHPAPAATISRYMQTVQGGILYELGKRQAAPSSLDQVGLVLDFGQPNCTGDCSATADFGSELFGDGGYASTTLIQGAVIEFLRGFIDEWGDQTPYLFLIVGTSSYQGTLNQVSGEHGQAWAEMINSIRDWIILNGYTNEVEVLGGSDIEAAKPGERWAQAVDAEDWTDGFDNAADSGTLYVDFGDAGGCPTAPTQSEIPGGDCNDDWRQEEIWYVAYGNASAFIPLPDIYDGAGLQAAQWWALYDYSRDTGRNLFIGGAFTQRLACYDYGGNIECLAYDLDNTPAYGYMQVWVEFFSGDDPNPQPLGWSTDITYINE